MKPWIKLAAPIIGVVLILVICLIFGLSSCQSGTDADSTTPPETEPPTAAAVDPSELYGAACSALENQSDRMVSYDLRQQRTVGSETYSDSVVGTAVYAGVNTESLQVSITESVTYGDYKTDLTRSYLPGSGCCQVNGYSFICDMTAEEFIAQEIPAVLLDAALYTNITLEAGTATTVTFSDPVALESWVCDIEGAQLITARGTAVLNADGALTAASYHAEYTISNASYTVDISTTVGTPGTSDLGSNQQDAPESCIRVNDLSIPKKLLQTVGNVYSTEAMTVSYTDTLYSEAFAVIRSQSSSFNTWGTGDDFIGSINTQVSLTDYTGTATANNQSISYVDGVYSYTTNGGEVSTSEDVTVEQVRTACEDSILASLIEFDCIASAEMTDIGDFLYLEFTGNDTFSESICDSIYALLGMDLDAYAESYATDSTGGYLIINKYTGLPTSLGMFLSRSHTISNVPYQLTYQLDQAMTLGSGSAYENITGQAAPEEQPDEAATPLFYKVTGEDGSTMWLLGTIHVGDERTGSLPAEIMDAFNASDALAVEFDSIAFEESVPADAALQNELSTAYYYSDGTTLSAHLSKSLYNQLTEQIMASGYNSTSALYRRTSMWTSLIETFYREQGSSLSADKGVDSRLLTLATEQGKTIYEIESGLSQIRMLSGFSDDLQAMLLEDTLTLGLIGYCDSEEQLYEMWCQGDEEALTDYMASGTSDLTGAELALHEEYEKAMTTDRNKVMVKAAKNYLQSEETVFYAVGLAHLLGEDGLVQALRDAGYTVELVTYE